MLTPILNKLIPNLKLRDADIPFFVNSGKVIGKDQSSYNETTVSGGGGTITPHGGHIRDTTVSTNSYTIDEFWIQDEDTPPSHVSVRDHKVMVGQYVSAIYVQAPNSEHGSLVGIQNHTERKLTLFEPMNVVNQQKHISYFEQSVVFWGLLIFSTMIGVELGTNTRFINMHPNVWGGILGFVIGFFLSIPVISFLFGSADVHRQKLENHIAEFASAIDNKFHSMQEEQPTDTSNLVGQKSRSSAVDELERLNTLRNNQVITEDEFNTLKQRLLTSHS